MIQKLNIKILNSLTQRYPPITDLEKKRFGSTIGYIFPI